MSWSASAKATVRPRSGGDGVGVGWELNGFQAQTGNGAVESEKAMKVAERTAQMMLESGAFGTGEFTVSLSGHANTNNMPTPGWSNDFVSITINQQG
jgi:hypothetical protein